MGAGHVHSLLVETPSPVHRLPPQCKVVATLAFVIVVVATPQRYQGAFAAYAVVALAGAGIARVPLLVLARRLVIEAPFLAFVVLLPVVGGGPRTEVLGVSLSQAGLGGAGNIVAKATLGAAAAVVLTATTPVAAILAGLDRLRMPRAITVIAGFMIRYIDVVAHDLHHMRIARLSRGDDPRWLWQARGVAATGGALFIRTYERGERVHLAMRARGYDGTLPAANGEAAPAVAWATALIAPTLAAVVLMIALVS